MGKGKSGGKLLFSLAGLAIGGWGIGGFTHKFLLSGALQGLSIAGSIWSATHRQSLGNNLNPPDIKRFDLAQETVSSTQPIPIVYGYRKVTGNQVYHKTKGEQQELEKHVILCESDIYKVLSVMVGELEAPLDKELPYYTAFIIKNTKDPLATISKKGHTLTLATREKTISIPLANKDNWSDSSNGNLWEWQTNIPSLIKYINTLGYGWQSFPTGSTHGFPADLEDFYVSGANVSDDILAEGEEVVFWSGVFNFAGNETISDRKFGNDRTKENLRKIEGTKEWGDCSYGSAFYFYWKDKRNASDIYSKRFAVGEEWDAWAKTNVLHWEKDNKKGDITFNSLAYLMPQNTNITPDKWGNDIWNKFGATGHLSATLWGIYDDSDRIIMDKGGYFGKGAYPPYGYESVPFFDYNGYRYFYKKDSCFIMERPCPRYDWMSMGATFLAMGGIWIKVPIEKIIKKSPKTVSAEVHSNKTLGHTKIQFWQDTPPPQYEEVGGYPKMSWLQCNLSTLAELSGNPSVSCYVLGKIVKDTRLDKMVYTNNPAMCLRDFILNKTYGLGMYFGEEDLDEDSFKEVANYCDEIIEVESDKFGKEKVKRYELNIIIDEPQNALDWLSIILGNFNGFLTFSRNKICLKVMKKEPISYKFNDSNCYDLSVTPLSLSETPNRFEVTFVDPLNNWKSVSAVVEDFADQQQRGRVISKKVSLEGTTSHQQAMRLARYHRDLNTTCPLTISFKTGQQASHLEAGDVFEISFHEVFKGATFRIQEIRESGDGTFEIKARQYNEAIYNNSLGGQIQIANYSEIPSALNNIVPNVKNVVISTRYLPSNTSVNTTVTTINYTLPMYPFTERVNIYYKEEHDVDYTKLGSTIDDSYTTNLLQLGHKYSLKFVLENTVGRTSSDLVMNDVTIEPTEPIPLPSTPSNARIWFQSETNKGKLVWDVNNEINTKDYVIRDSEDKELGTTNSNSFDISVEDNNEKVYKVYARDYSNRLSSEPAIIKVQRNIICSPPTNLTVTQDKRYPNRLHIEWDKSTETTFDHYLLYVGNEVLLMQGKENSYNYVIDSTKDYTFTAHCVSWLGLNSKPTTVTKHFIIEPVNATNITFEQNPLDRTDVTIKWTPSTDPSVIGYELREGTDWTTATPIATNIVGNSYKVKITDENRHTYLIKALSTIGTQSVQALQSNSSFKVKPSAVNNVVVTQDEYKKNHLFVTWAKCKEQDVKYYEVRYGRTFETSKYITRTLNTECSFTTDDNGGNVFIQATSNANILGYLSTKPYSFSFIPSNVDSLEVYQNGENVDFVWDAVSDKDISNYEIREGTNWEEGTVIVTTPNTYYSTPITFAGTKQYMVKAINNLGYYSTESTRSHVTVEAPQDRNVILSIDEMQQKEGTSNGVIFGNTDYSNLPKGNRFSDYVGFHFNEFSNDTKWSDFSSHQAKLSKEVLKLYKVNNKYLLKGEYIFPTIDVMQIASCGISVEVELYTPPNQHSNYQIQFRYSNDKEHWSEWFNINTTKYTFRYLQIKCVLTSNGTDSIEIQKLNVQIDVPEREVKQDVMIPKGGKHITYKRGFYVPPTVIPYAIGRGIHCEIDNLSIGGFDVRVINLQGEDVGGKINYRAIGY